MAENDCISLQHLQMADSQLYITVALFVAIAAIVTTYVRGREGSLLPRPRVNAVGLTLLFGSWVGILQIGWAMIVRNDYGTMSTNAVVDLILHSLALALILGLACAWYWAVAIYRETPAGMPTNPANKP